MITLGNNLQKSIWRSTIANLYIDFGGSNFRYSYDEDLKNITKLKSNQVDLKKFLDHEIQQVKDIQFIGISIAGQVRDGTILSSPNIDIGNFNIKQYIKEKYNIRLEIENDLNCAALAENDEEESDSIGVFYIGTGFGSAFIDNGKLIKGSHNLSGEMGHIPFIKTPFTCGCGRDDCVELCVSGRGIIRWCKHLGIDLQDYSLENLEKIQSKDSIQILDNFYNGLKHSFHTSLNLFDPQTFILGGGVGKKNSKLLSFLEDESKKSSFKNLRKIKFKLSQLEEGSLKGAKLLQCNHLEINLN